MKPSPHRNLITTSTGVPIGGLLGAISDAMGGTFVGGGVGLIVGSGDALPYRNRLKASKYLIVVNGSEALIRLATRTLYQFKPENIQGYTAADS